MVDQVDDLQTIMAQGNDATKWHPAFHSLCNWVDDFLDDEAPKVNVRGPAPAETGLKGSAPFSSHAFQGFNHIHVLFQTEHALKFKADGCVAFDLCI
jgi:hypothetical protein